MADRIIFGNTDQQRINGLKVYPSADAVDIVKYGLSWQWGKNETENKVHTLILCRKYAELSILYANQDDEEKFSTVRYLVDCQRLHKFVDILGNLQIDLTSHDNLLAKTAIIKNALVDYIYLVEQGIDVSIDNNYAVRNHTMVSSDVDFLSYLSENGADLTVDNSCAIIHAITTGHADSVKYLIDNGLDVNTTYGKALKTAVSLYKLKPGKIDGVYRTDSASRQPFKVIQMILEAGADISSLDTDDYVTISKTFDHNLIQLFIDYGADFTKLNTDDADAELLERTANLLMGQGVRMGQVMKLLYKN